MDEKTEVLYTYAREYGYGLGEVDKLMEMVSQSAIAVSEIDDMELQHAAELSEEALDLLKHVQRIFYKNARILENRATFYLYEKTEPIKNPWDRD